MTILVFSDSHGNVENMARAVERLRPREIFHLGDCWRDGEALHALFPSLPLRQVAGNCDSPALRPRELLLEIQGKRILLCHGHAYRVKDSLLAAGFAAEAQRADLFLFGHTHRVFRDVRGQTLFFNPGSIGDPVSPTFGVIRIREGVLDAVPVSLDSI